MFVYTPLANIYTFIHKLIQHFHDSVNLYEIVQETEIHLIAFTIFLNQVKNCNMECTGRQLVQHRNFSLQEVNQRTNRLQSLVDFMNNTSDSILYKGSTIKNNVSEADILYRTETVSHFRSPTQIERGVYMRSRFLVAPYSKRQGKRNGNFARKVRFCRKSGFQTTEVDGLLRRFIRKGVPISSIFFIILSII